MNNKELKPAFLNSEIPITDDGEGNGIWDGYSLLGTSYNWRRERPEKSLNDFAIEIGKSLLVDKLSFKEAAKKFNCLEYEARILLAKIDINEYYRRIEPVDIQTKWGWLRQLVMEDPESPVTEIPLSMFHPSQINNLYKLKRNIQSMLGIWKQTHLHRWSVKYDLTKIVIFRIGLFNEPQMMANKNEQERSLIK